MNYNPYNNGYPQGGYPQQPQQQQPYQQQYGQQQPLRTQPYQQQYTPYQPPQLTPEQIRMQQQNYMRQMQIKSARSAEKSQILTAGIAIGGALLTNLIIQVISVFVLQALNLREAFDSSFLFQHAFNIIVVDVLGLFLPFFLISRIFKNRFITPLVPAKKIGFLQGAAWVFIGLAGCFLANFLTQGIIELFKFAGYKLTQPESLKPESAVECVLLVFSTAVAPAIFEEFAMRCSSLGVLRRHGKAFAVVAVSIVFGLMHANVIQFVFAFTIGLILGYITVKTDSVIPAMFIHGMNNGLSVMQDILSTGIKASTASTITTVIMIAYFVLGLAGLVYLAATHNLLIKKEYTQEKPYTINFFTKLLLLAPGLFIPFVILIAFTSQYITKI